MAEGKKSFVLYCDLIHEVDHLTDEEKGILFQHLLEYVNDMNPVLNDRVILGSWKHIERQLKRDLRKYEEIREKRRQAGAKGGKQSQANQANASFAKQSQANQAVTDTVNVTVNDNVSSKEDVNASRLFSDSQLNDVFNKWLKMLDERKKPMTQSSIEALAMKLSRQPIEYSIKQIEQSLENNWLTLRSVDIEEQQSEKDMQAGQIMKELKRQALEESLYGESTTTKRIGYV